MAVKLMHESKSVMEPKPSCYGLKFNLDIEKHFNISDHKKVEMPNLHSMGLQTCKLIITKLLKIEIMYDESGFSLEEFHCLCKHRVGRH